MAAVRVVVASKYGATRETGEAIADELAQAGHDAKLEDVEGFDGDDAIVVGSAVYAGHWLKPAQAVLRESAYDALGRVERLLANALNAPEGDFRDWQAIRKWSRLIARELAAEQ